MIKYHFDIEQGSPEWHKIRKGIITASEVKNILTPAKLEPAKGETVFKYVCGLADQRLFGYDTDGFVSWDMERGSIEEVLARELYSEKYAPVKECGFVTHKFETGIIGCSPDGLVGDDGLIECKSRNGAAQIKTFISGAMPDEYRLQVQTQLLVTGRKWCDFISYSNGRPMFIRRIEPDLEVQQRILVACAAVNRQVQECIDQFKAASADAFETKWVNHALNAYNGITV